MLLGSILVVMGRILMQPFVHRCSRDFIELAKLVDGQALFNQFFYFGLFELFGERAPLFDR
jgi:hypothetical protein